MNKNITEHLDGKFLSKYKIVKWFYEGQTPVTLEIHNTYQCNYHCEFCIDKYLKEVPSVNGSQINCDNDSFLSKENIDTILNGCKEINIKGIVLSGGGDPSICPSNPYLVEQSNLAGIDIGMFTNGFALNDKTIPVYISNLTFLRFSFDSFSAKEYSKTKGVPESAYYKVLNNIKKCTDYKREHNSKCKIGIDFIIQPHNTHLILDIYKKACELNLDYVQFCDCVIPGYEFSNNQKNKILDEISKCLDFVKNGRLNNIPLKNPEVVYEPAAVENTTNCADCEMRQYIFQVGGDGGVRPCPHLARHDEMLYGNINTESLKEIWDKRLEKLPNFLYEYCRFKQQNIILKGLKQIEHGNIL